MKPINHLWGVILNKMLMRTFTNLFILTGLILPHFLDAQSVTVENFSNYGLTNQGIYLEQDKQFGSFLYEFKLEQQKVDTVGFAAAIGIDGYLQVGGFEPVTEFKIVNKEKTKFSFNGLFGSVLNDTPAEILVSGYKNGMQVAEEVLITINKTKPGKFYDFTANSQFYNVDEIRFRSENNMSFIIEHWSYSEKCLAAIADAGENSEVCASGSILTANNPSVGTGTWQVIKGSGILDNPGSFQTQVENLSVGLNEFEWKVVNGYCDSAVSNVQVYRYAEPNLAETVVDFETCSTEITLNANSPTNGTGMWTIIAGTAIINSVNEPITKAGNLSTGENIFVWQISNGICASTADTLKITKNPSPDESWAGTDFIACSSEVQLAANLPLTGTGEWSVKEGNAIISDKGNPTAYAFNLSEGENIFQWNITNECNTFSSRITITVPFNVTQANAGSNQEVCINEIAMNANVAVIGTGEWSIISGSGQIQDPGNPESLITGLNEGQNLFVWTIKGQECRISSDTVSVTVNPIIVNAGEDKEIFTGQSVTIGPESFDLASGTVFWEGGYEIDDPYLLNPRVSPLETTTYTMTYTDGSGCEGRNSVVVKVIERETIVDLHIPKGISPNNDGINDTWHIRGIEEFSNNAVKIFNRWGQIVFERNGYDNTDPFIGVSKVGLSFGSELPEGTYFYHISLYETNTVFKGYIEVRK